MEQLQRLPEVIADTYIRDIIRETGKAVFTHNTKTGEIKRDFLASGLVDNSVYAAKQTGKSDYHREAHAMLCDMISLDGRAYQITPHGIEVIETMH